MAISTEDRIFVEIKAYIDKAGVAYRSWYVGIAAESTRRLFDEHGVQKENGWWIFRTSSSAAEARRIEKRLLTIGCDGGGGGGDESTRAVYAYKKGAGTQP